MMLIKMIRTQTGELGTMHAGVAYKVEPKGPRKKEQQEEVALYLARGFAEETTDKELAAAKAAAELVPAGGPVEAPAKGRPARAAKVDTAADAADASAVEETDEK